MKDKTSIILSEFLGILIGVPLFVLFRLTLYININKIDLKLFQLFYLGLIMIAISIIILPGTYMSYKKGMIWSSHWSKVRLGGKSSWWIEEDIETDLFWKVLLFRNAIIISFFVIGIILVIISFFYWIIK